MSDLELKYLISQGTPNQSKFNIAPVRTGINKSNGLLIFTTNNAIETNIKIVDIARGSFMNSAIRSGNVRPIDRGLLSPTSVELVASYSSPKDVPVGAFGVTSLEVLVWRVGGIDVGPVLLEESSNS
ncbi:MAG: hypothetical protein KC592_20090 [Nitrospira sp.]|nr:hypothetical protein [Nitrospira sp.]